jgi:uracil-DNA glycosylase
MRATLTALTDELRRLKTAGVKTVAVTPEALAALRRVLAQRAPKPAPTAPAPRAVERAGASSAASAHAPETPEVRRPESKPAPVAAPALPRAPEFTLPAGDKATRWSWLLEYVTKNEVCCASVRPGKKVVLGVGSLDAKIFFCGEAPGAEEEVQGEPFVGPAGQLLTKMIQAMGLQRSDVYIGNIMNWRPQMPTAPGAEQIGNRPPTPEEMAYCLPFIKAQLEIVDPQVIVALGATAAKGLLGPDSFKAVGDVRGKWQTFAGKPLIVTYHPSYILRNQSNRSKRMIWEDLLKVMERVELPISPKQRGYFLDRS